ncbi:MAG: hypothetical protein ACOH1X_01160 [Kaistella sp.]
MKHKNILMIVKKFLFFNFITFFLNCSSSQTPTWYYAWNNTVNTLEAASDSEIIPALINGSNYRILKINNFAGETFKDFTYQSRNSKIEIFQLPLMQNHSNGNILDLILPLRKNEKLYDTGRDKYFLLKFKSHTPGDEKISLSLSSDKKIYTYNKQIRTGNFNYKSPLNLNVFAYFDYNFLIKDLKTQVIQDLVNHDNNVLVIPPAALPNLTQKVYDTSALRNYLKGTENKFEYYILYFNFNEAKIDFANPVIRKNMLVWYNSMMKVFDDNNINTKKVLLFPFDEPKKQQIAELMTMYKTARGLGIQNPFFVTVDNLEAGKALLSTIEFVQMKPETMKLLKGFTPKSQLWSYQLTYGSRDRKATEYRDMSITAFKNNATGIGMWSYADVDRAVGNKGQSEFSRGIGTWEINYASPSAEYALIYRKNNTIYSSLRWEALSFGMQDYFWLQLYKNKYGAISTNKLLEQIDRLSEKERDDFKLKILN